MQESEPKAIEGQACTKNKNIIIIVICLICIVASVISLWPESSGPKYKPTPFFKVLLEAPKDISPEVLTPLYFETYPGNEFNEQNVIAEFAKFGFIYDKKYAERGRLIFRRQAQRQWACMTNWHIEMFVADQKITEVLLRLYIDCM